MRIILSILILWLFISLVGDEAFAQSPTPNVISRSDTGCPGQSCIWLEGEGFGERPAVHLKSGTRTWIIPYQKLAYTRNEYTLDGINFKIPTAEMLFAFDRTGFQVSVLNNQTKVFSNSILVTRSEPDYEIPNAGPLIPFEVGGTNYGITKFDSITPLGGTEILVGSYHEDPARHRAMFQRMYNAGQRKMALVIWYTRASLPECRAGLSIEIRNGSFCEQHLQNIKDITQELKRIGYNELVIRFAFLGNTNPSIWGTFDSLATLQVVSAIQGVRDSVQSVNANSQGLRVLYDLCLECGGINSGKTKEYALALYEDYILRNGNEDTYGASIAYYPGRLKEYLQWLSDVRLPVPTEIGLDIYNRDGEDGDFIRIQNELLYAGIPTKTVTVLEAFYNNAQFSQSIFNARNLFRLNVRTVYQWQLESTSSSFFNVEEPVDFGAYVNPLAAISILGSQAMNLEGRAVTVLTMSPRKQYAAVEVASGDGLRESVAVVECKPYFSTHPKKSSCYFEMPADSRVAVSAEVRVVATSGAKSDWFFINPGALK